MSEAATLRICDHHYLGRLENIKKRSERTQLEDIRRKAKCLYCGATLTHSIGKMYCSVTHANFAKRIINDDFIMKLKKYSYWRYVEKHLLRNPLQLGSVDGLNDIIDFVKLYSVKSQYQCSYTHVNGEAVLDGDGTPIRKPIPWLKLEMCHIYPNSKGGYNNPKNLIIAPAVVNRMVKDTIPKQKENSLFNGIKSSNAGITIEGSLIRQLTVMYGDRDLVNSLGVLKNLKYFSIGCRKDFDGCSMTPFFDILLKECKRLRYTALSKILMKIQRDYITFFIMMEFFSIACFHSLLTGDLGGLLYKVLTYDSGKIWIKKTKSQSLIITTPTSDLNRRYFSVIKKYFIKYFNINISDDVVMIDFYNSLFSINHRD